MDTKKLHARDGHRRKNMLRTHNRTLGLIVGTCILAACNADAPDTALPADDGQGVAVGRLEQELNANQEELAAQLEIARSCFQGLKDCLPVADDRAICGEELKACLSEVDLPDFSVPDVTVAEFAALDINGQVPGVDCELSLGVGRFRGGRGILGRLAEVGS